MTTFHYRGGGYVERIKVSANDLVKFPTLEPFRIDLDNESLSMDAETASALALGLIEALYGENALEMETADRIANLANAVLADAPITDSTRCAALSTTLDRCLQDYGHEGLHTYAEGVRS